MESIWGAEHEKRMKNFDSLVQEIQNKYFEIFQDRVNQTLNKPDQLSNHFLIQWDINRYSIGFLKDTYVPVYVQKEVIEAFKSCFE